MKTSRLLNTLAFLSVLGLTAPAVAQEASTDARMNATAESVYHGNMKNVAEAPAMSLATLHGTRATTLSLAEQNSVSHQQAMNQIQAKMIAQTTITGATEAASAIGTVKANDMISIMQQLIASAVAGKQQEIIVTSPTP